jgi:hypothetical protein
MPHAEGGIECGEDYGKVCIIVVRSLYGLKSTGAAFRSSLAQIYQDLGYQSTKADPDVGLRKATKDDGFEYIMRCCLFMSTTSSP